MKFRADLEGLRGVAVALVVLFHFDLLGVRGGFVGVDAFYVLSGFLITSLLLTELSSTGGIGLIAFYARRARRILPAASVALVLTLVASTAVFAPLDQPQLALDATACGLFTCNITFAARATNYFASQAPSPFLHFWSLGVEEQFYLLWPTVLLLAFRLHRPRLVAWAVVAFSFGVSLMLTTTVAPWAFFTLPSRAWELGAGALAALYTPRLERAPRTLLLVVRWCGLALLATAALAIDTTAAYPGVAALVPTVGVVLVIAGGVGPGMRALAFPPLRWLGRISYSLYLYHWPVFVLGTMTSGPLAPDARALLAGGSVGLAVASRALIEEPCLRGRMWRGARRPFAFAVGATALVVFSAQLVSISAASSLDPITPAATAGASDTTMVAVPSAAPSATAVAIATTAPMPATPRTLRPGVADARNDTDGLNARGCGLSLAGDRPPRCDLGDADGAVTIALVGDSHAAQWYPALELIARSRGWRVVPFTKDSCIFEDTRIVSIYLEREYTECERWRVNVVSAVRALHPNLVVVTSSRWVHPVDDRDADPTRQAGDMARLVSSLGAPVALIADTPLMAQDVPACLSRRDRTFEQCGTTRDYALTKHLARDGSAAQLLAATLIDPALWLCDDAACPAVIDMTIGYRDDHHLTATMARRLAPLLEPGLLAALRGSA